MRRTLLDVEDPESAISDQYFQVCAEFIPMLEALRVKNLNNIYEHAQTHLGIQAKYLMPLSEVRKHIDYEKVSNQGLHTRFVTYAPNLLELSLEEMIEI